jgi:hypothetical protein
MRKDTELNSPEKNPGYEKRDVNTRAISYSIAVLLVVVVLSLVTMRWLFDYFSVTQPLGPTASPFTDVRQLPPQPRLQVQPVVDLDRERKEQEVLLNSYGWTDRTTGKVRIPIDRAMELIIERGLPTRPNTPPAEGATKEQKN